MTLTMGSCFAGIGGIDLGFEAAGIQTVWHSEINPAASRVMTERFPDSESLGDIRTVVGGMFPPTAVHVVGGGPPCQDVSIANSFGRAGLGGSRSSLFHVYAELIDLVQPQWVVMEQVTGLLTSGRTPGADYATVLNTFKELGYEIDLRVVNSLAYVPQTRERLIIVGSREPGAATRALLPITEDGAVHPGEGRPTRRRPTGPDAAGAGIYRKSRRPAHNQDGETWIEADYANTLTLNDVGVSRATVIVVDRAGMPRVLTPEEWEACHGFPAGWSLPAGSDADRWRTLGNAVSPPVAYRIAQGIVAVEQGRA
jgi:site-specific DNA-cytosine methylase